MSQQISVIGQVATDPKLFTPENGVQFCTFRLACTERRFDAQKNEWVDADTNWFTVNAFRTLATHSKESFAKGDRVIVSGRLRIRNWEKEEKRGTSVEIDIDGIGHDVRWGTSSFKKRAGTGATGDSAGDKGIHDNGGASDGGTEPGGAEPGSAEPGRTEDSGAFGGSPGNSPSNNEFSSDGFTPSVAAA